MAIGKVSPGDLIAYHSLSHGSRGLGLVEKVEGDDIYVSDPEAPGQTPHHIQRSDIKSVFAAKSTAE